ncbi:hypothetical protein OHC33_006980 [Knufia fluminis]|uniref:Uncharacterized protein n=1 Tax=Knufia fluminis TaxID=191047 RepID=A0AAN8EU33_9EURO|nr:hypothetical protein OHC33_006980 [Knufia fluminis]
MTSPPDSGGLFFSSSPTRYNSGPAEEVEAVLAQVQKIDNLDPSVNAVICANRSAFFETFSRRIELIKSRSQAFQDHRITIYDKVLLTLTQNGKVLDNTAAISFYCEEHLGIPNSAASAQKEVALTNALIAHSGPPQAMPPPETRRGSVFTREPDSNPPEKKKTLFETDKENNSAVFAALAAQVGGNMVRLWTVYDKAKKDFFAVTDPNSLRKQDTARFLRDTAENVLHQLRDKTVDQRLLNELSTTFETAKHTAMTLHGGKKRKFDQPRPAALSETPADSFNRHYRDPVQVRGPRPDPIDTTRANERPDKLPRNSHAATEYRDISGHSRSFGDYARSGVNTELPREQRRFFAPEISPKNARVPKQQKKQPGRGHSGVPYGYTRPVDSYYPS